MTKEQLMHLVDNYYQNPYREGTDSSLRYIKESRQALSDAFDAALKKARSAALEEAAKVCEETHDLHVKKNAGRATAYDCASAIRALKEET